MALEDAYLKAVWGTAPDSRWLRGISSRDFRLLVESLVVLFSSRLPGETHILAAFLLDHWRFAVISSVAKVIFGEHADPTCSAFCPEAPRYSLSWCKTFLGRIIFIFLQRPELGPKGCRMTSGEP
jgi:hypothetical protein